jgi:hypothetical protein
MAIYLGSTRVSSAGSAVATNPGLTDAVLYTKQALTKEQQIQARQNIGVDTLKAVITDHVLVLRLETPQ